MPPFRGGTYAQWGLPSAERSHYDRAQKQPYNACRGNIVLPITKNYFLHIFTLRKIHSDSILTQKAQLISVDRAGYGYSDYGKSVISIQKQAELPNLKFSPKR